MNKVDEEKPVGSKRNDDHFFLCFSSEIFLIKGNNSAD